VTHQRTAIVAEDVPTPKSSFSMGIQSGHMVFVSGQLGIDLETGVPPADVRAETELVIGYIRRTLDAVGLGLEHVAKTTVYVTDFADYAAINEVYAREFPQPFPARATVRVAGLLAGARLEIEAIAIAA
jgi:2-iminobutanoate/2-iminopropanoate deaminase